jgi:hypothetical protein
MLALGHAVDAFADILGKLRIGGLRGEADGEGRNGERLNRAAVRAFAGPFQQAAFDEALQQAKAGGFAQTRAFDHLPQAQDFVMVKSVQEATGTHNGFDSFWFVRRFHGNPLGGEYT